MSTQFVSRQQWVRRFYAEGTDPLDADVFAQGLHQDVRFVAFGTEAIGREAAAATLDQMRTMGVTGMRHDIEQIWAPEDDLVIVQAKVTYCLADGPTPGIPAVTIFRWRGPDVSSVRVFMDSAPLLTALAGRP